MSVFFKKFSLLCVFCILSLSSFGSFLVDPYLGYNVVGIGKNDATLTLQKYSYSAVNLGGRAGYQFLGFMGGIEYSMATKFTMETEAVSGTKTNQEFTGTYLGVFAGYELPILLRAWVGYYLDVDFDNAGADTNSIKNLDGNGIFLGVGFTGLPFISLNIEYRQITFSRATILTTTDDLTNKMTNHEVLATVSLPLSL